MPSTQCRGIDADKRANGWKFSTLGLFRPLGDKSSSVCYLENVHPLQGRLLDGSPELSSLRSTKRTEEPKLTYPLHLSPLEIIDDERRANGEKGQAAIAVPGRR